MNRVHFLLIVLLINSKLLLGQGVYFKASSNYNISASNQQMPEYFSYHLSVPGSAGTSTVYSINLNVAEFSIASGHNFQGTIGYALNDFLSFELKFSTFSNLKKEFEALPQLYGLNGKTEWDLHYYSLLPTVLLGQTFNKSAVNIFVYSGLGLSKLKIKASLGGFPQDKEYEFENSNTFSWGYGLEYVYVFSKHFSLFTNIGINNTNYTPERAELISSSLSMNNFSTIEKEIKYVDKITNIEVDYSGSTDSDSPEIRLKEKLKLNSVYLGIGFKYTLNK